MKAIYRADDDTEFEDEEECRDYERKQELMAHPFKSHLYITNGTEIHLSNLGKYLGNIGYLDIVSNEDWEILYELMCNGFGYDVPRNPGKWYYDTRHDEWCNFQTLEHKYQGIKKIFEQGDQTS